MPGISFVRTKTSSTVAYASGLLANNLSGAVPPTAPIYDQDLLVRTAASSLTANGVPVMRPLLAADKTAHYKQGTPVAGIAGVAVWDVSSNAFGQAAAGVTPLGGAVAVGAAPLLNVGSMSSLIQMDTNTGRSRVDYAEFNATNVFAAFLDPSSAVATPALIGTLAGFILTTGSNAPGAPTLATATTGGTILAGTYYVVITYTNAAGETLASAQSSITTTGSTSTITVTSPSAIPSGVNYKVYIGTVSGGPYYLQNGAGTAIGGNYTITAPPSTTTATAPTSNTSGQPGVTMYTVDTNAAALDQCITIIDVDPLDVNYGLAKGRVLFTPLLSFCQNLVGVNYSSQ